jgi:hypothetical protein
MALGPVGSGGSAFSDSISSSESGDETFTSLSPSVRFSSQDFGSRLSRSSGVSVVSDIKKLH